MSNPTTVGDVIALYLAECRSRVENGTLARSHFSRKVSVLQAFAELLGGQQLGDCKKGDLSMFLAAHPAWKNPHTRVTAVGCVVTCFRWAEDYGFITRCLYKRLPLLCGTPRPREAMKPEEYRAIMQAARESNGRHWSTLPARRFFRRMMWFLWNTGCRTCEAREARWTHVDWKAGVIRMSEHKTAAKTGADRIIPMSDMVVRYLRWLHRARAPGQEFILPNLRQKQTDKTNFNVQFRRFAARAGVRKGLSPYSARHGFTCRALDAGIGERQVADVLGQRSTRFVEWYSRSMRSKTSYLRNTSNLVDGRKGDAAVLELPAADVDDDQGDGLPLTPVEAAVFAAVGRRPTTTQEIITRTGYQRRSPTVKLAIQRLLGRGQLVLIRRRPDTYVRQS